MINNITLVRGDDTNFLNQVLLVISFKTNLDLAGYKLRFTVENPTNLMKTFEVINNAVEINLDKMFTSTLEVGLHKCNVKLIDTLNRVRTVKNFTFKVESEFDTKYVYPNEYEVEIELDDGINKYKNYNELSFKPMINHVVLEGDKTFDELGITKHIIDISQEGIKRHNEDTKAHKYLQDQIFNKQDRLIAGAGITIIDGIISSYNKGNNGITTDYKLLGNKPKINNVVLDGNLSLDELGIQPKGEYITEEELSQKGYLTVVPSGYITEEELQAENFLKEIPDTYFTDEQNEEKYFTKQEAELKQDVLTAGENIKIEDNVISSSIPDNYVTQEQLTELNYTTSDKLTNLLNKKQDVLLAGDNIKLYRNIDGSYTISALSPKDQANIASYNTLKNLPLINNVLLTGNKSLDELGIQPKGEYQEVLTAGENIVIENNTIKAVMPDNMCTDLELNAGLSRKADKSTTLAGYNIEDAYTKEETQNIVMSSYNDIITDTIISAPNGVLSYTETSITAKEGLEVLFSDGIKEESNTYNNLRVKLDKDLMLDLSNTDFIETYKHFYVILTYNNNVVGLNIIPKSEFKTFSGAKIPNIETGYIKNISDNKFYRMIYKEHGIYESQQVYIKIIAEGTATKLEQEFIKIVSLTPYFSYRFVNQDEIQEQIKDLQPKFELGEGFAFNGNKLEYQVPYNYVTKEYLIENEYATFTNINDGINNHNTDISSHEDIRKELNKKQTKLVAGDNVKLSTNSDGTQTISSVGGGTVDGITQKELETTLNNYVTKDNNYVTRDNLTSKLQSYALITDIPDTREYVTNEELAQAIAELREEIAKLNTETANEELNTESKTVIDAVNEVNTKVEKIVEAIDSGTISSGWTIETID
jgi:hypothetical protein